MIVRINMVGHFTIDVTMDVIPYPGSTVSYKRAIGRVRHVQFPIDAPPHAIVVCDIANDSIVRQDIGELIAIVKEHGGLSVDHPLSS